MQDKPIRLIELFAGYGSQALALKRLGVDFETQCYKQAGNSIVVAVLEEIFKNIYLGGSEKVKAQIDIFDILD